MKAPGFWWREPGLEAALLSPIALVYGAIAGRRMDRPGQDAALPVICVGNVTVGGSGKTPTCLAIAALLRAAGRCPAFLTRGYGGSLPGPILVDPARHGSAEVGDEAMLLARAAPTIVSRDRPAGATLATSIGADVLVMDDGLQNPSLAKDIVLAVFDGAVGMGNGHVLPAGPLRAPLRVQWPHVDAVVIIGAGEPGERIGIEASRRDLPVFTARLEPRRGEADRLEGRRVLAFAGIGRPGKFFATCREAGMDVVAERSFPDHHPYDAADLTPLLDEAERDGLVPVTTEKDAVRFMRLRDGLPGLALVQSLPIELRFADDTAVAKLLRMRVARPEPTLQNQGNRI